MITLTQPAKIFPDVLSADVVPANYIALASAQR